MIQEVATNISVNTSSNLGAWVQYLRVTDPIWLVKENELAFVMEHFSYREGRSVGLLKLRRMNKVSLERWYMTPRGNGFDGMPLIWPVTELPEEIRTGDGQIIVGEVSVTDDWAMRALRSGANPRDFIGADFEDAWVDEEPNVYHERDIWDII